MTARGAPGFGDAGPGVPGPGDAGLASQGLAMEGTSPRESAARWSRASGGRSSTRFVAATRVGDLAGLERLFAEDVVSRADSGGVVRPAARVPVVGRRKVARLLEAYAEIFWAGGTVRPLDVNGDVAVGPVRDGKLFCVLTLTASERGVDEVLWQMNPAKLEHIGR